MKRKEKKMKKLLENLADLIKVKTLITFGVIFALIVMYLRGKVDNDLFMAVASSVVTYYFTRSNTKEQ